MTPVLIRGTLAALSRVRHIIREPINMLSIRLQRIGKSKEPHYRVIVTEKSRDPWGKHNEILGTYNPRSKALALKEERVSYWIGVGAQPTNTLRNLLINANLLKGKKGKAVAISRKRQAKINETKAQATPEEASTEAPAA